MPHPKVETLAGTASKQEIITILERDGALILKDVLDENEIAQLRAEVRPYIEASEKHPGIRTAHAHQ